jgi:hypothetical protein
MQSNDSVGTQAFGPGFQPYKVTLGSGALLYLVVMEDKIVASDDTTLIGRRWTEYRPRLERNGAVIQAV